MTAEEQDRYDFLLEQFAKLGEIKTKVEIALRDAISTFQNDTDKTTMVTRERIEAWEATLELHL